MKTLLIILAVLFAIVIISAIQRRLSLKMITLQQVTNIEFIHDNLDMYAIVTYGNNSMKEIPLEVDTNLQIHLNVGSVYVTYLEKR